jgi:glycosyltransferase involved in cell wall biosynthesis
MTRTVLLVHNFYQQPGGEDEVFATEARMLEEHGHTVVRYTLHNDRITSGSLRVAAGTIWSSAAYHELRQLMQRIRPAVAHFHNTFPLISPSAYHAARREGIPVVQTLHNYRLFCVNAQLYRDGRPCEDCLGLSVPWHGVQHACYRSSRLASATVASMVGVHRALGTWTGRVNRYIALTEFARTKCIAGGLPAERVVVKPNFIHPDPGPGDGAGAYALFVGRLSPEKGVRTLLAAWRRLGAVMPLRVVGDGPLATEVRAAQYDNASVSHLGRTTPGEVLELIGAARCLICPSEWYEGLPRVVVEALARGTPVIASRIGSLAELVQHERTGRHFRAGDSDVLARQVTRMAAHSPEYAAMRRAARAEFEARYTEAANYAMLMTIYESVMAPVRATGQDLQDGQK